MLDVVDEAGEVEFFVTAPSTSSLASAAPAIDIMNAAEAVASSNMPCLLAR